MVNIKLLDEIIAHIEDHPEEWKQDSWAWASGENPILDENGAIIEPGPECGTAYCIAGHVAKKFGAKFIWTKNCWNDCLQSAYIVDENGETIDIADFAAKKLGLDQGADSGILFDATNTLQQIKRMRDNLAHGRHIEG